MDASLFRRICLRALLAPVLFWAQVGAGQEVTSGVPVDIQAMLFKKIFLYDRALAELEEIEVLVVDDPALLSERIVRAFNHLGVRARLLSRDQALEALSTAQVVYLPLEDRALSQRAAEHRVLTISGNPELALGGSVSVALRRRAQRPEILLHAGRAKQEGRELSADLLKVSTVIR